MVNTNTTNKEPKKGKFRGSSKKPVKVNRSAKISFRTTIENKKKIKDLARSCGLSVSLYLDRVGVGQHPRLRLTEKECDALMSITDARADLVNLRSALKGKTYEQKLRYFNNEQFMKRWIADVNRIIQRWDDIEENILN